MDVVSVVDDVFTTGSSLELTINHLTNTGVIIAGCHVIVARGDVSAFLSPVSYLFKPEDIR